MNKCQTQAQIVSFSLSVLLPALKILRTINLEKIFFKNVFLDRLKKLLFEIIGIEKREKKSILLLKPLAHKQLKICKI